MADLRTRLQIKSAERLLIIEPPDECAEQLAELAFGAPVDALPLAGQRYAVVLVFARMGADIARLTEPAAGALADDGLFWWAYPKKSSKRYASDLSRDEGWASLYGLGFGPVRQIAIDEDWSAVRFRPEVQIARGRRGA